MTHENAMIPAEQLSAVIRSRRTIHDFKSDVPDREQLLRAIDTACWAPNHKHTRPWRFYLLGEVASGTIVARYRELVREKKGTETARIKSARWEATPAWFIVTSQKSTDPQLDREDYGACCCMVQNLALLLWNEGIGLKWASGPITADSVLFDTAGIDPAREFVVGLFGFGYPADIPTAKRSPAVDLITQIG